MKKTYKGCTASKIINSAEIARDATGMPQIWATCLGYNGITCHMTDDGNLALYDVRGHLATLETTLRQRDNLSSLEDAKAAYA